MGFLGVLVVLILIIVVVIIGLIVWVIRGQKNLVHSEELCGNALSQIGIQQASRWDALTALADLTKQYSDQEYNTLMDVIRARQGVNPNTPATEVDQQEGMLQQATSRLMAVAEAYPDLKSNTLYLKTMDSVHGYEDNVRMSRMVYNDTVTRYNRLVRSLPGSLVAGSLGFAPREYLENDATKANMPSMAR
ncbi:LemA family protein [Ruminococcaceae bacterium OttesenSCG-928-A16]|nr:LemA family protein [Ruminococcaceae bacterium OttesenSCG-928-A16]